MRREAPAQVSGLRVPFAAQRQTVCADDAASTQRPNHSLGRCRASQQETYLTRQDSDEAGWKHGATRRARVVKF
ncbi:hypothetical protein PR202_gb24932 [Eleusine coracana subsp. coracana]|uniref:Uncharacterized protein n=1 Tax=Eleusine coracana subsp. coracana TaxID=191504 RepID=A0AAV5FMY1_ELECO|nr:hypothetical protein PR202_gb24932 [Eleusine coracana subsp. coracana]